MRLLEFASSSLRRAGLLLAVVIASSVGLGVALTAGNVLATHDGPDTIHACVTRFLNVTRIVDDPSRCRENETLVEWPSLAGMDALQTRVTTLEAQISDLQAESATQQGQIEELIALIEDMDAPSALPECITTEGNDVVFVGCNVHVRNGMNGTDTQNGAGNLIIGYNENESGKARGGSHNLVVGPEHGYSSFGGFVAGESNTVSGPYASVSGGFQNTSSGFASSVGGGRLNTSTGTDTSISGGEGNVVRGFAASVSGGLNRSAIGNHDLAAGAATQDF